MIDWPSRALLALTSLVVVVGLAGLVLATPERPDAPTESTPTIPDWALAPAAEPDDLPTGPPAPPLMIAFGGDVHAESPIDEVLARGDNPLEGMADVLSAADVAVVNLETPIATSGTPADKTYTFRADPALARALADAGVDVVNLANNHALDYGIEAAEETIDHVEEAGMTAVGYGEDATSAYAAHVVEVEGRSVALVGLTAVMPIIEWSAGTDRPGLASAYDGDAAVQAVRNATEIADHVVVVMHWGRERWTCPHPDQRTMATALARAGADVIAGHHPHVLQGVVEVADTLVAYSLGNLLFYARTPATRQSGVLTVTLDATGAAHAWSPATIDHRGRPQPAVAHLPITEGEELTTPSSGPECGPIR